MAKKRIIMGEGVTWQALRYYWFNICFKMFLVLGGAVSTGSLTWRTAPGVVVAMITAGCWEILRMKGKNDSPPNSITYEQTEVKEDKAGNIISSTGKSVQ